MYDSLSGFSDFFFAETDLGLRLFDSETLPPIDFIVDHPFISIMATGLSFTVVVTVNPSSQ